MLDYTLDYYIHEDDLENTLGDDDRINFNEEPIVTNEFNKIYTLIMNDIYLTEEYVI